MGCVEGLYSTFEFRVNYLSPSPHPMDPGVGIILTKLLRERKREMGKKGKYSPVSVQGGKRVVEGTIASQLFRVGRKRLTALFWNSQPVALLGPSNLGKKLCG